MFIVSGHSRLFPSPSGAACSARGFASSSSKLRPHALPNMVPRRGLGLEHISGDTIKIAPLRGWSGARALVFRTLLMLLLLAWQGMGQDARGARSSVAQLPLPAAEAFAQWLTQQRNLGQRAFTDPQANASGLELARARAHELRALMERDPEELMRRAMPEAERAQLPSS